MSDVPDFLRKKEEELKATRHIEIQRVAQEAHDAALLRDLVEEQWPLLQKTLRELVEQKTYDGKTFLWSEKTLALGNVTLTVWMQNRMGLGQNDYNVRFWKMGEQPGEVHKLIPSLSKGELVWSCSGANLGKDRSTAAVAQSLIEDLANRYTEANSR